MSRQVWIDPNNSKNRVFIDSKIAPPLQPGTNNVSAGNATVPAGYIRQIGWDGFMDTGAWNYFNGLPQVNIFIPGVPYFTGGWPPDPQAGQPYHTPPNVGRKDGIQD
jgi:hypothetical protein